MFDFHRKDIRIENYKDLMELIKEIQLHCDCNELYSRNSCIICFLKNVFFPFKKLIPELEKRLSEKGFIHINLLRCKKKEKKRFSKSHLTARKDFI